MVNADISCIDLFAGCGGLSLGVEAAGIPVSYAVEIDRYAAETYRRNFPHVHMLQDDIAAVDARRFHGQQGKLIIVAGPPCQPFSSSNRRTRGSDHPGAILYQQAIRFILELQPDAVVFENVEGFGHGKTKWILEDLCRQLEQLGYQIVKSILSASDFGIPQVRRRLFVSGTRFPFLPRLSVSSCPVGVWDAIGDLPNLPLGGSDSNLPYNGTARSSYAAGLRGRLRTCSGHLVTKNGESILERYKFIPPGGNWKNIPPELMTTYLDPTRCHTGIYHRLSPDLPSKVIGNFRKNMLIHPYEHRGLSVREAARLQSFPDWFRFSGSIGKQQQQVGNAVPPLLAKTLIEELVLAMSRAYGPSLSRAALAMKDR